MFSWFKKKEKNILEPSFDFPFQKIEPTKEKHKNKIYTEMWKNADRSQGFPVFVLYNELLHELLLENDYSSEADIEAYFRQREAEEKEFLAEVGEDIGFIMGKQSDKERGENEFSSFDLVEDVNIFLASIPVENPWQIFEKIPFGAYNECPEPSIIAAFAKMAYEKFGAIPAVISADTLEFSVQRRPSAEEALDLAWKMFLLCPDTVNQGHKSVYALADCLTKSGVWTFWWD